MTKHFILSVVLTAGLQSLNSQTNSKSPFNYTITPVKIIVTVEAGADSASTYGVQILDSKKKIVEQIIFPKKKNEIMRVLNIQPYMPGDYTMLLFRNYKEIDRKSFFKDGILTEPQGEMRLDK